MSRTPDDIQAEVENQRAIEILRSLKSVQAPASLRHIIEAMTADAGRASLPAAADAQPMAAERAFSPSDTEDPSRSDSHRDARAPLARRRSRPAWRRAVRPARMRLGLAGALAAAALLVLALALPTGGSRTPTVLQASAVTLRAATRAAPLESPHNPHQLAASAAGLPYPYWGGTLGWQAAGARTDHVGGRTVTTVFYTDSRARRIGYSIVSGGPLPLPAGTAVVAHGLRFHIVNAPHSTIVTWREAGHTCILAARAVDPSTLVRLAAWERA
ncbi:MAG TPA: hypothetical protein VNY52_06440 [Solirubrobacteraceae bacterium]|jgi:hypothetical protein|nr:hypothetical protein [Solirubrobacteraceae bacterium]